ncbi:hypothetical protein GJW-30_1_02710 [Variibacter gotjawalensis]|uniref:DUF3617 family protein n=1 Tax=Variibacter gotjawalensis TaxID=1333996 RepID=A0A0S3PWA7_9BRAD|nr:DUF3617 family protein [Variibacter gotjawalensis]NIK46000.1 hypothetical protein [Variibacter gotjawalensis]RZS47918.1 uncharacterized protein DUF3617 [Variibacter gotjawalensis]BAT60174.1 hypothetical protein GJW-30_1_02710 [Variibacter gotjawalensis]
MIRTALTMAFALAGTVSFASAQALDLPPRKPGQWEVKIESQKPAGAPAMAMQACIDAATDKELMEFGLRMGKDKCQRFEMKREAGNIVIDATCKVGPVASTTRTIISGDFQSAYNVKIDGTTTMSAPGMPSGPQPMQMTQAGRWVAATCGGGMVPGDIQMQGLPKMNIKQLKQLAPMLGL